MKLKYFALFAASLLIFQLSDFLFFGSDLSQTNSKFIFGSIGSNLLAVLVAAILVIVLYLIIPKTKTALSLFCFLVAGAMSNIIDRLIYGGVVDYIKIWFIPIFNFADFLIIISVIIIFIQLIKKSQEKR